MTLTEATRQRILFCEEQARRPAPARSHTDAYLHPFSQTDWLDVARQEREALERLQTAFS